MECSHRFFFCLRSRIFINLWYIHFIFERQIGGLKPKMKKWKVVYYLTTVTSMLVGLWHFFVPIMFQWYDYLPMQYENLIVGIDYTNACFSALLFGGSLLLVFWGKRVFTDNKESKQLYFFYTIVWLIRAALATFIEPWPLEPVAWAAILQFIMSDLLAICMVVMSIKLIQMMKLQA